MPPRVCPKIAAVHEFSRLPRDLEDALSGDGFRRRRRLVVPLLTTDPRGFPRVALLTLGEVRAASPTRLAVAVMAESRSAFNLVRRKTATILYMQRQVTASIQARAGRGCVSGSDPARHLFPLSVERVRIDRPGDAEGDVSLLTGPTFTGRDAGRLFSDELFAELGKVAGS